MEERTCTLDKMAWAALLESMPPEARAIEVDGPGPTAIILISPFGYRLKFIRNYLTTD